MSGKDTQTTSRQNGAAWFQPWSFAAAALSLAVLTYNGVSGSFCKELAIGFGREPHWLVLVFDQAWCIPVGAVVAAVVIVKDLRCSRQTAVAINAGVLAAAFLVLGIYVWAQFQPWEWPHIKRLQRGEKPHLTLSSTMENSHHEHRPLAEVAPSA